MAKTDRHTWIIADTHFNHLKLCEYCTRPPNFGTRIKSHWVKMIQPHDLVYHLGDFFLGKKRDLVERVHQLPGTKILIRGNHDKESTQWYLNHGFAAAVEFVAIKVNMKNKSGSVKPTRVILSHKPIAIPKLDEVRTINIHGHFHNNPSHRCEPELINLLTEDHYLFSLEEIKYKPILLDRALIDGSLIQGA